MEKGHPSVNLDLLRSTAILFVVQSHLWMVFHSGGAPFSQWGTEDLGNLGVRLFFIHTSLVLMFSLDRLHAESESHVPLRFYVRRFFRIYPLSVTTVLLMLALRIPAYFGSFVWPATQTIVTNLLLVQNLFNGTSIVGPLWTLPLEVQMYLLFPALYALVRQRASYAVAFTIVAAAVVLKIAASIAGFPYLIAYAPAFAMGILSYCIARRRPPIWNGGWFLPFLLSWTAVYSATQTLGNSRVVDAARWGECLLLAIALPCFADLQAALPGKIASVIAKYSYSIYLWHVPIMWFAFEKLLSRPNWFQFLVFGFLIVAVPALLYNFVEAPLVRAGKSIAGSLV